MHEISVLQSKLPEPETLKKRKPLLLHLETLATKRFLNNAPLSKNISLKLL